MTFLLDANVLIAMVDPDHVHHEPAQLWFERTARASWATCPLTENALLRIAGNSAYPLPGSPVVIAGMLHIIKALPGHVFWPDDISLAGSPLVDPQRLTNWRQLTDTYLLALAAHNGGKLATFDRKLSTRAVMGGAEALHVIGDAR